MADAQLEYQLGTTLTGHSQDVRAVTVTPKGSIISGSRDTTCKIWWQTSPLSEYKSRTLYGHQHFVSSLAYIEPSMMYPAGLILSGSHDNLIKGYEAESGVIPLFALSEHKGTVCCLSPSVSCNVVLSSSWDGTAKKWDLKTKMCMVTYEAEQNVTIWSVIQLASLDVVCGCADKSIRVFADSGSLLRMLDGHTDVVRGLCSLETSPTAFISTSNDSTVRVWDSSTGQTIKVLANMKTDNYYYSVAASGDGTLIAAAGEGGHVSIWKNNDLKQFLTVPCQSVWCIAMLPNTDLVCGGSDGSIRVYSTNPARQNLTPCVNFEEVGDVPSTTSTASASSKKQLTDADFHSPSALLVPGKKEGEIKLVRDNGVVKVYTWSSSRAVWDLIGDMIGGGEAAARKVRSTETKASEAAKKTFFEGQYYDYVIKLNINSEKGGGPLHVAFNNSDDPHAVASNFITKHGLKGNLLEEIRSRLVDTIEASSSRSSQTPTHPSSSPMKDQERNISYFPRTEYVKFDKSDLQVIKAKLIDNMNIVYPEQTDYEINLNNVDKLFLLTRPDREFRDCEIDIINDYLKWPNSYLLPILDILRLAVRNKSINSYLTTGITRDDFMEYITHHMIEDEFVANKILSVRTLCNLFSHPSGEKLMADYMTSIITHLKSNAILIDNKQLQIAVASLIVNYIVFCLRQRSPQSRTWLDIIVVYLPLLSDPEAQLRMLAGFGTLLPTLTAADIHPDLLHFITSVVTDNSDERDRLTSCCSQLMKNISSLL